MQRMYGMSTKKPWQKTLEVQSTKQRMVFRMIHVKDSRSYQWEKFGRLRLPGYIFTTYPDAQCMAYLPTFTINLGQM